MKIRFLKDIGPQIGVLNDGTTIPISFKKGQELDGEYGLKEAGVVAFKMEGCTVGLSFINFEEVPDIPMVTIPKFQYEDLLEAKAFLNALRAVGVDNWEGYDEARSMCQEEE